METSPLLQYDVLYPERLNRWLPLVKWFLVIPHYIILTVLSFAASVVYILAFFAILFTGRYPRGLFDFSLGVFRWAANVNGYTRLLRDEYPPFSLQPTDYAVQLSLDCDEYLDEHSSFSLRPTGYPIQLELEYPERLSRWKIFLKWLFAIPHLVVLYVLLFAQSIAVLLAFFAILFTGRYPRGLFDFVVGVERWTWRVNAYLSLLTDAYPPFSLAPDIGGEPLAFTQA
jgi:hypothetical protein